jgi:DHA1 family bicyclomycin/chloramphenicol resistance-like MFS transporter
MVMVVLPMLSPALGGELIARFGFHSVFVVTALMCVLILVFLSYQLPETLEEAVPFEGVRAMILTYFSLFKSRIFCGYAFCVTFVSVVFFSFISAAPEIMVSVLKRPATEYGYYFIIIPAGFMTGNYVARHFNRTLGLDRLITIGAGVGVTGICLALLLQLLGFSQPLALFLPIALATFGNGITLPNAQAAAINQFPKLAGSASGLTGFLQMAFSAVAAQFVAVIYNGTVYPLLLLMLSASVASLLFFRWGLANKDKNLN